MLWHGMGVALRSNNRIYADVRMSARAGNAGR